MDSDQESIGRRDADTTTDESETGSSKTSEYSPSISTSSSDGSSDDYIQVDPKTIFTSASSGVASSKSHSDAKLLSQSVTCNQLKESSKTTSTSSTSQVSDVTHESEFSTISQSPSIQVMKREAGFDPNRIPSSIFGSKDSSSKEWSAASTESLFSIHTPGNGSPARDDIVMTDGDLKRARKRDNCAEVDKNEKNNKSELTRFRQTLPITKGGEHKKKMFDKERKVDVVNKPSATGSSDEATKRIVCFREEMKVGENINRSTAIGYPDGNVYFRGSVVRPSDGNGTCSAAPMKEKSSWWSCCSCSIWSSCSLKCSGCSCKWLSCSSCACKWPSCSFKWLSCSSCSCKWPSCSSCSCKWLSCSSCSFKWPSCSCKWFSCSSCSCKWPSCSSCSCKWLSCSSCSCKWLSCSSCSFKCPSCSSCSCKWPSMPVGCCKWPSCKCKCLTSLRCCC